MIASIWAQSPDRVIGVDGKIPWHYPGDFKRFKRVTLGGTVVMGRKTFDSIGKPLPGRQNVIITSRAPFDLGIDPGSCYESLESFLFFGDHREDVWIIGGAMVYADAMSYVDVIDVTYVPDRVDVAGAVLAPSIDEAVFEPGPLLQHEDEPSLSRRVFVRRTLAEAPFDLADNRRLYEAGCLRRRA